MNKVDENIIIPYYQEYCQRNRSGLFSSSLRKRSGRIDRHSVPIQSTVRPFETVAGDMRTTSPNNRASFFLPKASLASWRGAQPVSIVTKMDNFKSFEEDETDSSPQSYHATTKFHRSKSTSTITPIDLSSANLSPHKKLPKLRQLSPNLPRNPRTEEVSDGNTTSHRLLRVPRNTKLQTTKMNSESHLSLKSSSPKMGDNSLPPLRQNSCRSSGAKISVQSSVPLSSHTKLDWAIADYEEDDDQTPPLGSVIFLKNKSLSMASLNSMRDVLEAQKTAKNFIAPLKSIQNEIDANKTTYRSAHKARNSYSERRIKSENKLQTEPKHRIKPMLRVVSSDYPLDREKEPEKEKERNPRSLSLPHSHTHSHYQTQSKQTQTVSAQLIVPTPSNKQPPLNKRRVEDIAESLHKQKLSQFTFSDSETSDDFEDEREDGFYGDDENEKTDSIKRNRYENLAPGVILRFSTCENGQVKGKLEQNPTENSFNKKRRTNHKKNRNTTRLRSDSDETRAWNFIANAFGQNENTTHIVLRKISDKKEHSNELKRSKKENKLNLDVKKKGNSKHNNGKLHSKNQSKTNKLIQETTLVEKEEKVLKKNEKEFNENHIQKVNSTLESTVLSPDFKESQLSFNENQIQSQLLSNSHSQSPQLQSVQIAQSPQLLPQSPQLLNSDHVKSPVNSLNLSFRTKRRVPISSVRAVPFGETQLNVNSKNLTIIQVFYRNDPFPMFATLAITSDCTAKDICVTVEQQILENLPNEDLEPSEPSCFLYEVEAQSTNDFETMVITKGEENVRLLSNDELVVPCLVRWKNDRLYRFYMQCDTINCRINVNQNSARSSASNNSKKTILINVSEADSLWINENELTWEKRIGLGAFSKVYKAIYRGKLVAVKILKGSMDTKTIGEFRKEFEILRSTHNDNLVHFYGACHNRKLSLVMEFCQRGTLLHVMNDPTLTFTMDMSLNFAAQTCRALAYLHGYSPQIIHRDLKSLNLLVTKDWEIRISDFGLSRFNTLSNNMSLNNLCGTMTHCAPEIFMGESYTTKSDIYSMGIILWEMFNKVTTGEYSGPFSSYKEIQFDYQIIIMAATKNLRPPMPAGLHPPLWQVLLRCWAPVSAERPDACLLERTILQLQFNYNSEKKEFSDVPLVWD